MMTHKVNYTILFMIVFALILSVFSSAKEAQAVKQNNFVQVSKSLEMLPLFLTIGIVGGCIALTLAFVSWQKYKAEKKKRIKKESSH